MSEALFEYEAEEALEKTVRDSTSRNMPVTAKQAQGKNLVHLLANKLLGWPMTDLRLETDYQLNHDVESTDTLFMQEVSRGMEMRIARKDIAHNMLWVEILYQGNMAEYERFNIVALNHNEQWTKMDCPTDVFDPKHGDITPIADTYVAPAAVKSRYIHDLPSVMEDNSYGPIASARPGVKRSVGTIIQYHIELNQNTFLLEYVAKDTAGHVLYYNSIQGPNLTHLIRRSVQELWGNPSIYGNKGAYLEGISMLYQGRKMSICRKENHKPSYLTGYAKDVSIQLAASKVTRGSMTALVPIFAYVLPILFGLATLWWTIQCIMEYQSKGIELKYVVGELMILTLCFISVKIAQYLTHKEHAQSLKERFI